MADYDLLVGIRRRRRWPRRLAALALVALLLALVVMAGLASIERGGRAVAVAPGEHAGQPQRRERTEREQHGASNRAGAAGAAAAGAEAGAALGTDARGLRTRPLAHWLGDIAGDAGLGLVVAPGLDVEALGAFRGDTPWPRRLAALARVHGFDYRIGDAVIEVAAPEADVPVADGAAAGASADRAAQILTRVFELSNARATELADVLLDALRDVPVALAADPASNAIVASGPRPALEVVERVASRLDVERRRFLLDAMILEMASSTRTELGVQWRIEHADLGAFVDFPREEDRQGDEAGIVVASSGTHNLRARIGALEAGGRLRVISRPRIVVVEGKPASIESVRVLRVRFPDRAAVVSGSEDVAVGGDRAVEAIPVGVSLQVEPAMQGLEDIVLRIRAESSNLGQPLPPDDIPEELSRVVDAEIVVADGETAVLGGLLQVTRGDAGAGLPYLRRVPLVGLLFGRRRVEREGQELLVLVTPRLLEGAAR